MREEHMQQVERWALYVKEHPEEWQQKLKKFIDAQIIIARRAYAKLAETEQGREKIRIIRQNK